MRQLPCVSLLFVLVACGDDDGQSPGLRDATVSEAGTSSPDASMDAQVRDARVADATQGQDAHAVEDAARDAATPRTLRARLCGDRSDWPTPLPPAELRTAQLVKDGFDFVEGPVWIDGALLFSDMNMAGSQTLGPPSQIHRLVPPAAVTSFVASSGSNGIARWSDRRLIAATHDTRSLSFFDAQTGARADIAITFGGKKFNSPNDLAVREDGWVYFTDPNYQLGTRTSETKTAVYRVKLSDASTSEDAILIDDSLDQPNGIALSPDQQTLYVGSADNEVFRFDVAEDGNVTGKTVFAAPGNSDGFTVDCAGNLYVTAGTVQVFAPNGDKLGEIDVGDSPSNVAFGGTAAKTLYITAQDSLYAIELNVPGFPY
jgi:gluconolactonase